MSKTVVKSWNEWDPLKHVIVGRADNCHIPPEEPALEAKVPEDSDMRGPVGTSPTRDYRPCQRIIGQIRIPVRTPWHNS